MAWVTDVGLFFFSSRRRHTIFDCDWSSDVCSSDLFLLVSGCHESVRVQFPRGVFRYIEPDDVALRIDTACLCRDHVFPWKVDGSELALSEEEPVRLIRRIDEKSNDLAGGINVTSIGHHAVWWIDHFCDSAVHLVGMEMIDPP